jgi:hypothetical protein
MRRVRQLPSSPSSPCPTRFLVAVTALGTRIFCLIHLSVCGRAV